MQLRIIRGEAVGTVIPLDKSVFSIGREDDNDYVIHDAGVSRHHCRLSRVDDEWLVEDCQSVNGVLVNERRVDGGMSLQPGDKITVFSYVFQLEQPAEKKALPSQVPSSAMGTSLVAAPKAAASSAAAASPLPLQDVSSKPFSFQSESEVHASDDVSESADTETGSGASRQAKLLLGLKIAIAVVVLAIITLLVLMNLKSETPETPAAKPEETVTESAPTEPAVPQEAAVTESKPEVRSTRGQTLIGAVTLSRPTTVPAAVTDEQAEVPPAPGVPLPQADDDEEEEEGQGTQPAPKPVAVQAPTAQTIIIRSEPAGAEVIIDEQVVGTTPAVLTLPAGKTASVDIVKQGYERMTRLLGTAGGAPAEPFRLVQKTGTVLITSTPSGASIREGRVIHGSTPLLLENLQEGTHEFVLDLDGYERQKLTVELTRAKGETVHADMPCLLGTLSVTTIPAGCTVSLDGAVIGTTEANPAGIESLPLTLEKLLPGNATLRVTYPETNTFDSDVVQIPKSETLNRRVFLWIPTHKITLHDGTVIIGLLLKKQDDDICIVNAAHRQEHIPPQQVASLVELSKEEKTEAIRNKAELKAASGQQSVKSVLSTTVEDFFHQTRMPLFREDHFKKKICLTGDISARMKNNGIMTVMFGKQIRCIMSAGTTSDDWQRIGELTKARKPVSIRGTWEGTKDDVHVFTNCVFLTEPD